MLESFVVFVVFGLFIQVLILLISLGHNDSDYVKGISVVFWLGYTGAVIAGIIEHTTIYPFVTGRGLN